MSRKLKRVLLVSTAIAGLAMGGAAIAGASGDDDGPGDRPDEQVTDKSVVDRASAAALEATGGGTIQEIERADEGDRGYEVEVDHPDGTTDEVNVDESFKVVSVEKDD